MKLYTTLLTRLNNLTNTVNGLIAQAKNFGDLPIATLPLDTQDLLIVSQSGVSKQIEVGSLDLGSSGSDKTMYGNWHIFGHYGDSTTELAAGNLVQGWFSSTEFWTLARYDGGDVSLRSSYTVINSTENL